MPTLTKPVLSHILDDDALTRGLGDPEARILVEWLVEQAERQVEDELTEAAARQKVIRLCLRGRAIGRFVALWSQPQARGAAFQLAAAERFNWPFPPPSADPYEVMQAILLWEKENQSN